MDGFEHLAGLLKALGHPVRLQILHVLREEEACVCHLEAVLGQRQAYISQQLMRLRDAGLVADQRDGMNVYYRIVDDRLGLLLDAAQKFVCTVITKGEDMSFDLGDSDNCGCPKCERSPVDKGELLLLS
jgi:ArsR family transcriptional regulator